jgi:murein DD-endopeptidase MepM/ murein hydrolase activator NlpD
MRRRLLLTVIAGALATLPVHAQSLKRDEVYSSIAVRPLSAPNPVRAADGRTHLAYELLVVNPSNLFITLEKVEAVDKAGKVLSSLAGDRLAAMMRKTAPGHEPVAPGGTATVFLDVSFAPGLALPQKISARITASRQIAGPDGKPSAPPADFPLPITYSFTGAETALGKPAVVVAPPLRGDRWVAVNGCCDSVTSHREAVMAVNGQLRVAERFAVDLVQLNATNQVFTGDGTKLSSYSYYGVPVYSVALGIVVNLYDATEAQTPNQAVRGINTENIGGNMLVIDIGGGNYAFYAHLQRGSLKVKLGDHVTAGQVIGLLGNTGNTTAPHLHFHLMDGPSPLDANGLPFEFSHFTSRGVANLDAADDPMEKGTPVKIDASHLVGAHTNELPLNNEVIDFR